MQQDYSSLSLKKVPKNYAQKRKIQSHIFKKLIKEGEIYQVFTKGEAVQSSINMIANPESNQIIIHPSRNNLLPAIAQPAMQRYEASFQMSEKIAKKQPKLHPILKYNSQKWLSAAKAKSQQEYLYKGKKKFEIKTTKLSQERPKNKVRKSDPGPFLNLFVKKGAEYLNKERSSTDYQPEASEQQASKIEERRLATDRSVKDKLKIEQQNISSKKEASETKGSYFKLSEPITGWNTTELQYDPYF